MSINLNNFMKNIFSLAFLFFPLIVVANPALNIQHWQTGNGAQVYFVETPEVPMVEINVVFAAGSARDSNKPGLSQLTNEMLNQGTKTLNADQIAAAFDNVGAQYSDSVTRDMGVVSLQSLSDPKYLTPALQTFVNVLSSPTFPIDAFNRTQKQALNAITAQQQTPDTVAKNAFYATLYGDQPYGHPVLGTMTSVPTITASDLQNFYNQYYVAKNAIVTIVGAVKKEQAQNIANQVVNSLPSGQAASTLLMTMPLTQARQQIIQFPSEQTNILIGGVGVDYNDPNYFPLMVGNTMLGGSPLTSLLFNEVREKRGLAYSAASAFVPYAAKGPFVVVLQTRNNQAKQAMQVVQQTLAEFIKQGPTDAQLAATKKKIVNAFPLSLLGNDAISNNLMTIGFYHLPLNYLDTYVAKVNAVTSEQVKQAFAQIVQPEKMVTVTVGNS